jgi:hypothetical protein
VNRTKRTTDLALAGAVRSYHPILNRLPLITRHLSHKISHKQPCLGIEISKSLTGRVRFVWPVVSIVAFIIDLVHHSRFLFIFLAPAEYSHSYSESEDDYDYGVSPASPSMGTHSHFLILLFLFIIILFFVIDSHLYCLLPPRRAAQFMYKGGHQPEQTYDPGTCRSSSCADISPPRSVSTHRLITHTTHNTHTRHTKMRSCTRRWTTCMV